MKDATAQKILHSVKKSYNVIANEFSDTRVYPWDEFKYFKNYLFENAEIVDLGCGNGRLIKFLDQYFLGQNYQYIGIDNSTELLKHSTKKFPGKIFLPGDQLEIPLTENKADIIFNIAAFHHLPSKSFRLQALYEMERVLKPGGILVLTVWNLWQKKYWLRNLLAWFNFLLSLGDLAPNDLFFPWKNSRGQKVAERYYHNFLPFELKSLVKTVGLEIIDSYSTRKETKTSFFRGHNYTVIAQKRG